MYAQLLGARWPQLAESIRLMHAAGTVRGTGVFQVRRGTNRLARLIAWLAGLPAEAEAVEVRLTVRPVGDGEKWRREFGTRLFKTRQRACLGRMVERVGCSELFFHLDEVDGAIRYQSTGAGICVGTIRLPLPACFSPRVTAWEKAASNGIAISVEVCMPLLGRVIAYDGILTRIESGPC